MISAQLLRATPTFAAMAVHIGMVLRELYLATGLKMERFRDGVPFSDKTIYYHFGQADLNTSILQKYEDGLKKLGFTVDIWDVISRKRRGENITQLLGGDVWHVQEPGTPYGRRTDQQQAADLLRQAADLLSKGSSPAPDRDKEST